MSRQRVLVVGVGSIGERHLRCFQATDRAELSLVETNPEQRRAVAERYAVSQAFESIEAALRTPPDLAVIATPAPSHVAIATAFVEQGAHVLIEKPLSTSLAGVDELSAIVARSGVVAGVAYVYRAHPLIRAMKAAIDAGRFGRPVELVAVCGQHFPTYRPAYRSIYYVDHATGGGAIQDALTHVINAGEWLVGPVDRLVADAAHQVLEGVAVEDTAHILARHGPVLASYALNQHQAPNEVTISVICDRGVARCAFHESRWRWMTTPGEHWHDEPIAPLERDMIFITQAHDFLDAIEGRRAFACSLEDGLRTLRVNLAALDSLKTPGWRTITA